MPTVNNAVTQDIILRFTSEIPGSQREFFDNLQVLLDHLAQKDVTLAELTNAFESHINYQNTGMTVSNPGKDCIFQGIFWKKYGGSILKSRRATWDVALEYCRVSVPHAQGGHIALSAASAPGVLAGLLASWQMSLGQKMADFAHPAHVICQFLSPGARAILGGFINTMGGYAPVISAEDFRHLKARNYSILEDCTRAVDKELRAFIAPLHEKNMDFEVRGPFNPRHLPFIVEEQWTCPEDSRLAIFSGTPSHCHTNVIFYIDYLYQIMFVIKPHDYIGDNRQSLMSFIQNWGNVQDVYNAFIGLEANNAHSRCL